MDFDIATVYSQGALININKQEMKLWLRNVPAANSKINYDGIDEYCGYAYGPRSIELAGNICVIRAKTVATSTIDNITAPWYLIIAYGNDEMGMDTKEAWIYGGYVKEIKESSGTFNFKNWR